MRTGSCFVALLLLAPMACVPADEALALGGAQFTITGRGSPRELVMEGVRVRIDRFLIGFKTMTIVNLQNSDQCSYRGQGKQSNVLFDAAVGSVVQSFNGMKPGPCPDVGLRLSPPDDRTALGEGATAADLISFATGSPVVAQLEATVREDSDASSAATHRLLLRFDMQRTSSAFGGCRDAVRGARLIAGARDAKLVAFSAEVFFRTGAFGQTSLRLAPFLLADRFGNDDGVTTMDELDGLPLRQVGYSMPSDSGMPVGALSFGDYVRFQFRAAVKFGEGGVCNGLAPGTKLDE